jgi:hypothetical protein
MSFAGICLLATAIAAAVVDAPFTRVSLAQIPEAPGTFTDSNGVKIPQPPWGLPLRKIDDAEKAKAQASETPRPDPTPG